MTQWTTDELDRVGGAEELGVSSKRADGTDRPFVTIWVVRVGDELYIRSAYGTENPWFRRATAVGAGRVQAGGVERDVTFTPVPVDDTATHEAVDAAYHAKYDHYGPRIVGPVVDAHSYPGTLRLITV